MLEAIITSKARRSLLALFLTNPDRSFYLRQIEKLLKASVTPLRRELMLLEKAGLLLSETKANVKYYTVNKKFPLYSELKSIIFKTTALADLIKKGIIKIGKINYAFVYGSYAAGQEGAASDIDLFIIGKINIEKLNPVIRKIESQLLRRINYSVFELKEVKNRFANQDDFIAGVLKNKKIMLIGDEGELHKVIG